MRQDIERQKRLEPKRMSVAIDKLAKLGFEITYQDNVKIQFLFKGETVTYYAYSGWAAGKSIKDGRGIDNLLNQLKLA